MKLADMHKNKGLKINNSIKPHGAPGKPGEAPAPLDRREQRKLDQEKGLVPFACKLNLDLINQVRALAEQRQVQLNDLVGELLAAGLQAGSGAAAPAPTQVAEEKPKAAKPKAPKK
jgi:hypothetical protein